MSVSSMIIAAKNVQQVRRLTIASAKTFRPVIALSHRYGPEALTGLGIAGGVGTVVLASRATLKVEGIVDRTKRAIELAELEGDDKAARKARVDGLLAILKLYSPSITLGAASAGAILAAHGVMRRRNVALAAAYKAIETSFAEYRKRVVDEYGEDKDRDYRYGLTDEKIKDEETGKTKTVTHVDPNKISLYSKFFDEQSSSWSKNPDYNLVFLRANQNQANDMLQARGHIFLNEVYDMLGLERTQAGAAVGWSLKGDGDKFVDFGIYDFSSQKAREFVNGHERSLLLNFNVDGVILDLI